jgi:hypothetical protein
LPLFLDIDFRISANELSIATEFTSEGPQKFNAILDVLKPFFQTWRHHYPVLLVFALDARWRGLQADSHLGFRQL